MSILENARQHLDGLLHQLELAESRVKTEENKVKELKTVTSDALEAQKILQSLAQETQKKALKQIAKVVSKCLCSVFEIPYEFRIEIEMKRGKTEVKLIYLKHGRKVNPKVSSGGVRDIAALALRLCSLTLSLPTPSKSLFLDEPFRGVEASIKPKVAALIKTLSIEMGMQFVVVTHDDAFEMGRVIHLK